MSQSDSEKRPIEHVVLFKFKDISADYYASIQQQVRNMKDTMEGILEISFGKTFTTERSKGYTHGLRAKLINREYLPVYAMHDSHLKLVELFNSIRLEPPVALDWEYEFVV